MSTLVLWWRFPTCSNTVSHPFSRCSLLPGLEDVQQRSSWRLKSWESALLSPDNVSQVFQMDLISLCSWGRVTRIVLSTRGDKSYFVCVSSYMSLQHFLLTIGRLIQQVWIFCQKFGWWALISSVLSDSG